MILKIRLQRCVRKKFVFQNFNDIRTTKQHRGVKQTLNLSTIVYL